MAEFSMPGTKIRIDESGIEIKQLFRTKLVRANDISSVDYSDTGMTRKVSVVMRSGEAVSIPVKYGDAPTVYEALRGLTN